MKVKIKRLLLKIGFVKTYYVGRELLKNPPSIELYEDGTFKAINIRVKPKENVGIRNSTLIRTFNI